MCKGELRRVARRDAREWVLSGLWRDGVCSENSRDFSRLAVCTLHKGGYGALANGHRWSTRPRRNRPYVTYVLVAFTFYVVGRMVFSRICVRALAGSLGGGPVV